MDRYAVIGFPVQHSWSPFIHGMFAKQTAQDMQYRLLETPPEQLIPIVSKFFAEGGKGLNVTVPHKQAMAALVTYRTPRAEIAGAVNTIALQGDDLLGDNTDGVGLVADLTRNLQFPLTEKRILLIGAGGAARGVLGPLLEKAPALVQIVNRDGSRAEALAREFAKLGTVSGGSFTSAQTEPFDLVVNATSAGLQGKVPPVPAAVLGSDTVCYDMSYGKQDTPFVLWAKECGVQRAELGWGMLIEQAAEAFALWRGVRPDTKPVFAAVRDKKKRGSEEARKPGS
jgi:shikimate dehydrogenase